MRPEDSLPKPTEIIKKQSILPNDEDNESTSLRTTLRGVSKKILIFLCNSIV